MEGWGTNGRGQFDSILEYINILKNEQKVGMLLQKRTDTRGVGISSMRKSIYLLTTTPSSHTHRFHPLSTIVIHTLNFAQVKSMDDNCGEWVECMGVASGCGEQEVGVCSFLPTFCSFKKLFFVLVPVLFCNYILCIKYFFRAV